MSKRKAAPAPAGLETVDMRIEYTPISAILAWPRNPKAHDEKEMDASIDRFGFNDPPALDETSGHLVEGHGRVEALERRRKNGAEPPARVRVGDAGEWLVPIVRGVSFKDELEAEAYVVAHNRVGEGIWNNAILAEVLATAREVSLEGIGYSSNEAQKIILQNQLTLFGEREDDDVPEPPAEPITQLGDVWRLGKHLLVCGDSLDPKVVAQVLKAPPHTIFTDPPYGVNYSSRVDKDRRKPWGAIANDHLAGDELVNFLRSSVPEATYRFVCCDWHTYSMFERALGMPKAVCVWDKGSFGLGKGYRRQHEFILFYGTLDRSDLSDVWQVNRDARSDYEHPTQKPCALVVKALQDVGAKDVFDPFMGSGTTLIAAERAGISASGIELDPRYCDVIVERWQRVTGEKAKRK